MQSHIRWQGMDAEISEGGNASCTISRNMNIEMHFLEGRQRCLRISDTCVLQRECYEEAPPPATAPWNWQGAALYVKSCCFLAKTISNDLKRRRPCLLLSYQNRGGPASCRKHCYTTWLYKCPQLSSTTTFICAIFISLFIFEGVPR